MLPKRLAVLWLIVGLVLLSSAGCRVAEETPTKVPTDVVCLDCDEPNSPLKVALNSPLSNPSVASARATPTLPPVQMTTSAPTAGESEFNLTILHTNDTWGYLDPCG